VSVSVLVSVVESNKGSWRVKLFTGPRAACAWRVGQTSQLPEFPNRGFQQLSLPIFGLPSACSNETPEPHVSSSTLAPQSY
jgi:hypothetical protein